MAKYLVETYYTSTFKVTHAGQLTASAGQIAGFIIDDHSLTTTGVEINDDSQTLFISSSAFKVDHDGTITGSQVQFTGGTIGGYEINASQIKSSNDTFFTPSRGMRH